MGILRSARRCGIGPLPERGEFVKRDFSIGFDIIFWHPRADDRRKSRRRTSSRWGTVVVIVLLVTPTEGEVFEPSMRLVGRSFSTIERPRPRGERRNMSDKGVDDERLLRFGSEKLGH
jgi:hypothetical protein